MNNSKRPLDNRRADYSSFGREDQFIVPLLGSVIEGALDRYARPANGKRRVLDIGCGAQPMRERLEQGGYIYVGVDVVQNVIGTVDVIAAIDQSLPSELLAAQPFDLLLCTEVLEHVAHWAVAFENFSRLLAPGGRLIITCPFVWKHHEEPYDFWRPTVHAIQAHADRVGLVVLEKRAEGTIREVLGSIIAQVQIAHDGNGPWVWFRRRLIAVVRLGLTTLLKSSWFRGDVRLEGEYHLTTFAVLTKPAGAA
ncbi:MAG TPA: class I SAM-dependent methyltransferase [Tepidisphaeraceae bacterium]|jgi:SAM-dependent methyltransferase